MGQTFLSALSIELAKMISDELTIAEVIADYTQDGQRLTAEQRITAINNARSVIYYKYLNELKNPKLFVDLFPEYTGIEQLDITSLPEYVRNVFSFTAYGEIFYQIPAYLYSESLYSEYSPYYKDKGNFFVSVGSKLIPTKTISIPENLNLIGNPKYTCVFLKEPVPVALDDSESGIDIPERIGLKAEILQEAFKQALVFLNYQ